MSVLTYLREFRERTRSQQPAVASEKETESVLSMPLNEFRKADLAVLLKSYLLGDDFYLVSNPQCLQYIDDSYVTYLPEELEIVYRLSRDSLKKVHEIKKRFGGKIIGLERKHATRKEGDAGK